jgi:predicted Zn-dependent protease
MVSFGSRYRVLIVLFSLFLCSCEPSADQRGETIPPKSAYSQIQRPSLVVSYMTQLLRENESAHLYYLRAKAYFQLRDYAHAENDIERSLEKSPGDVDYLLLSSQIKCQLGWYSQALEEAKALESSGNNSPALYLVLSEIYIASNSKRLASNYLQQAVSQGIAVVDKPYASYLQKLVRGDSLLAMQSIQQKDLVHPKLSSAYFRYQLPRMAKISYQNLILVELKKYPFDPYLLLNWGRFLSQIGLYERAEKVYLHTLPLLPKNPFVVLELGQFYVRIGNNKKALVYLNQVPRQSGGYRDALFNQALVYLNMGEKSRSLAVLDSGRLLFKADGRFVQMRDRLLGKRIDSTLLSVDSTGQKSD